MGRLAMWRNHGLVCMIALCVMGVVLGGIVGSGPIRAYDIWWHLRLGQDIIRTGQIGLYDQYSHTAPGAFRPPQQWLFEVAQAAVYDAAGDEGMVWMRVLLLAASVGVLALLLMRRGAPPLVVGAMLMLVAAACGPSSTMRPHLVMPLMLMTLLWLLDRSAQKPRLLLFGVPLFVLWANLHASFTLGLGIVGVWAVWQALGAPQRPADGMRLSSRGLSQGALMLVGCAAACLINPVGVKLVHYSLQYLPGGEYAFHSEVIQEWLPPDFGKLEWASAAVLLGGGGILMLLNARQVSPFHLIVSLVVVLMALRSARAVQSGVFVMAWMVTPVLSGWVVRQSPTLLGWRANSEMRPDRLFPLVLTFMLVVGPVAAIKAALSDDEPIQERYPSGAVEWVLAHDLRGNMYNPYRWGGYLIHRLYPRHHVFIDGRMDMYGEEIFRDYEALAKTSEGWEEIADKYRVKWGIAASDSMLGTAMRESANWAIVYDDDQAMVFVKRDGENAHLTAVQGTR